MLAIALSFSFVYALTTALSMTMGVKEVLIAVSINLLIYSLAFGTKLALKISICVSMVASIAGLVYFVKNPMLFNVVVAKAAEVFFWFISYMKYEALLSDYYQNYLLLVLSIGVSLAVYLFAVKRFNFYVLLLAGVNLFVAQWILQYFASELSFYLFVFFILVCYFKHIYIRNNKLSKADAYQKSSHFILLAVPICALVFILAWYMPAPQTPIEWKWMDSKIGPVQDYVKTRFNIANSQYYDLSDTGFNENGTRLGGNVRLDDTVVMKVDSSEASVHLKGAVRQSYTGFSWESTEETKTALGQQLQLENFNKGLSGSLIDAANKLSMKISYENLRTKTLFIPENTESIGFDTTTTNVLIDTDELPSSESILEQGYQYTVQWYSTNDSESFVNLLRNSNKTSQNVSVKYLELPIVLPERVKLLAYEITSAVDTSYDRVKAIETYLSSNYPYTLEPGELPKGRDFVDYFLFDIKQGYCTYYASAMTVLVRCLGIPARYVEGYILPPQPVTGTTYEVTNKQAHAWVEVYFEEVGWVTFEPTAAYTQDYYEDNTTQEQLETEQTEPQEELESEPPTEETTQDNALESGEYVEDINTGDGSASLLPFIKVVLLVLLGLVLWAIAFNRLSHRIRLRIIKRLTPQQGILKLYSHFLRVFRIQGFILAPGETAIQYSKRIDESFDFSSPSFTRVTDIFIRARYGELASNDEEMQLIIDFYHILPRACKQSLGGLKYFIYNNILGWI